MNEGKVYTSVRAVCEDFKESDKIYFWRARITGRYNEMRDVIFPSEGVIKCINDRSCYVEITYRTGKNNGERSIRLYGGYDHYIHFYTSIDDCISEWNQFISNQIEVENKRHDNKISLLESKKIW